MTARSGAPASAVTVRAAASTSTPASLAVLISRVLAFPPPPGQASLGMVCAKPLTTLTRAPAALARATAATTSGSDAGYATADTGQSARSLDHAP